MLRSLRNGCAGTRDTDLSWRVDETYVRVGGRWKYLFRAVDKHGQLIDFSCQTAETWPHAPAQSAEDMRNWPPAAITTDKLGSYPKALRRLKRTGELGKTPSGTGRRSTSTTGSRPIMVR